MLTWKIKMLSPKNLTPNCIEHSLNLLTKSIYILCTPVMTYRPWISKKMAQSPSSLCGTRRRCCLMTSSGNWCCPWWTPRKWEGNRQWRTLRPWCWHCRDPRNRATERSRYVLWRVTARPAGYLRKGPLVKTDLIMKDQQSIIVSGLVTTAQ